MASARPKSRRPGAAGGRAPSRALRLAVLGAFLALGGRAGGEEPSPAAPPPPPVQPEPWKAPEHFLVAWLRGAAFFPTSAKLSDARLQPAIGIGLGVRLLPFAMVEAEGGWISRDFASPGMAGRADLSSRCATLGVRLHRELLGLEPSAFAGAVLSSSVLEVPAGTPAGVVAERAWSTGLALGAALDVPLGSSFSVGLDWRRLWDSARFDRLGVGKLELGGHALGAVCRLYWP